jgi:hypothetical protein
MYRDSGDRFKTQKDLYDDQEDEADFGGGTFRADLALGNFLACYRSHLELMHKLMPSDSECVKASVANNAMQAVEAENLVGAFLLLGGYARSILAKQLAGILSSKSFVPDTKCSVEAASDVEKFFGISLRMVSKMVRLPRSLCAKVEDNAKLSLVETDPSSRLNSQITQWTNVILEPTKFLTHDVPEMSLLQQQIEQCLIACPLKITIVANVAPSFSYNYADKRAYARDVPASTKELLEIGLAVFLEHVASLSSDASTELLVNLQVHENIYAQTKDATSLNRFMNESGLLSTIDSICNNHGHLSLKSVASLINLAKFVPANEPIYSAIRLYAANKSTLYRNVAPTQDTTFDNYYPSTSKPVGSSNNNGFV